jgi:hypothetical protein
VSTLICDAQRVSKLRGRLLKRGRDSVDWYNIDMSAAIKPESGADLYLVSCVSRKLDVAAKAKDLYISPWFKKARTFVESTGSPWRILSAKHHLVDPNSTIEPYELTLKGKDSRRRWADLVLADLRPLAESHKRFVILAGKAYREILIADLRDLGIDIEMPMEGLGIGQQLRWLGEAGGRHGS